MLDHDNVRRKLLTYSLVSHQMSDTRDPISALSPFFTPIANDQVGQVFDATNFRGEMSRRYGLAFSRDVTEVFVARLLALGFLKRDGKSNIWVGRNADSTGANGGDVEILDRIVKSAQEVIRERSDLLKIEFDEDMFLDSLLTVVLDQNTSVQDAVRTIIKKTDKNSDGPQFNIKHGWQYVTAEFIEWTKENDPDLFIWISDLSGTAFVSESLVDIRTPSLNQNVSNDLTVYLDGPFLMELIGTSGEAARQDAKYIVETLKAQRIPVATFSHSIDELESNLRAVLSKAPSERRGPTAAALLYREVQETVLQSILSSPEHFIKQEGVGIINTDSDATLNRSAFSKEREQSFYASLYSHYEYESARERDVKSIVWVMCRRRGEIKTDLLKSKHILLSRNSMLANLAEKFCKEQLHYRTNAVPPVVTVRDLAGVLWLLVGNSERHELSQRQMLLSCHRARAAAPDVVAAMLNTVRGVNENNAELLWAAAQQPKYLAMTMDAIIASGQANYEIGDQILSAVKDDLVSVERKKSSDRESKLKEKHEADIAMQSLILNKTSAENEGLKKENSEKKISLQTFSQSLWKKNRRYFRISYIGCLIAFNVLIIGLLFAASKIDSFGLSDTVKNVVLGLSTILGLYVGNHLGLPQIRRLLENWFIARYRTELEVIIPENFEEYITSPNFG